MIWKIASALAALILGACTTHNEPQCPECQFWSNVQDKCLLATYCKPRTDGTCPPGWVPEGRTTTCVPQGKQYPYPECIGLEQAYQQVSCETEAKNFREPWKTYTSHEPAQNLYKCEVRKPFFSVVLSRGEEYPKGFTVLQFSKGLTYPGGDATLRINDRVFKGREGSVPFTRELLDTMNGGGIGYWHTYKWPSGEYTGKVNFEGFADAYSKCYAWIAEKKL